MGKIKEHLDSYMHVYDNGTTARLYATPWDRNTVADGYWQTVNTIQPLINRDVYLADCIEELSSRAARYEAGSGISFSNLPDGTTQINASFAFGLSGSNGIAVNENTISLSGGTIAASFRLQNLSAKNLSAGETNLQTVTSVNHSAQNLTATNSNITNITATTITSTNISTNNLTAENASANNFSGTNISANKFSANSAQFNDISAKNFSANQFSATSGTFTNLTSNNISSTNLSGTNLTSVNSTITSLSSTNISATDISSTNLTGSKFSATYLSAKNLTCNTLSASTKITTKTLTVSGGANTFSVSGDFAVFSAAEAQKHSLSATLTMLNNNNTNYGMAYFEFGPHEKRYKVDFDPYWYNNNVTTAEGNWNSCSTRMSNGTIGGYVAFPDDYDGQNARNIEISNYLDNNITDYVIRKGQLFTYNSDHRADKGIGCGLSLKIEKLKRYQKYRFSVVNLSYCNIFADYIGLRFYSSKIRNLYFYNVPKTPLYYLETAKYADTGEYKYTNHSDALDWIVPTMCDFHIDSFRITRQFMANSASNVLLSFSSKDTGGGICVDVPLLGSSVWCKYKDLWDKFTIIKQESFSATYYHYKADGTRTYKAPEISGYASQHAFKNFYRTQSDIMDCANIFNADYNTVTISGTYSDGVDRSVVTEKPSIETFMNGTIEFYCDWNEGGDAFVYILNSDYEH